MMVVLTFHVGALTYFNTLKCSHASLHPGKAGQSCKQPLRRQRDDDGYEYNAIHNN